MTCPRCRKKAPPGAASCPTCGAGLGARARRQPLTGLRPTLSAIAKTAARLCEARDAHIFLLEARPSASSASTGHSAPRSGPESHSR